MTHERDLLRAIVLSGAALAAGCATPEPRNDAGATPDAHLTDTGAQEDAAVVADAGEVDAGSAEDAAMPVDAAENDAFVAIL